VAYDEVTAQLMRENETMRAALRDLMTARDQFAKAAMQGMWASDQPGYECSGKPEALLQRAETAYAQADAMLQVRSRGVAIPMKGQR
jgi:hypothetical protein